MLLWLALLNVVLSIMNGVNGVEGQNPFVIWVSGFNAAGAFALFLMWLLIVNRRIKCLHQTKHMSY